ALDFQNPCYLKKAQQLKPNLYDGCVIEKSDAVVIPDTKETLRLAEESRSKMIEKQNDPKMTEKKTELSTEQALWSQYSVQTNEPNLPATTIIVEVPKELSKVMVNSCLKKLKFHLASFDMVVKERTTATAITEGTWGFEHTKACFPPKLHKNRIAHTDYIRHSQDEAATLREIVESERLLSPLYTSLDYACKYTRRIQELLVVQIVLWYLDSGCSKHMTGDRFQLINFVQKFLGMVKFRNDHVAKIMGYGDYQIGNVTISRVYHVEGLGHLLYSQFRWTCAMGKSTKKTHKPKSEDTNQEKLYLLHTDLCVPMRVESVNGKKYILVIVDDYSRFTWVKFLRSKDETLDFIIKFLKMIQVRLKVPVCRIRTDNGTEFVNQMLRDYYEEVGISHETSVARSPQQNGVVERRNRTLIEAARTMLIYAQAPLFLWAKAVATACFTQNRSIIRLRHGKTPYELLHIKLPDLLFFHVFGALCYPTNDSENLGKLQPKADIGIFIGYAPTKKAFRIYNRRTRRI
nr:retrovirus-related Pol polyprotein from transposon TNT 1-94 [Tanacetum cinerariifolium]